MKFVNTSVIIGIIGLSFLIGQHTFTSVYAQGSTQEVSEIEQNIQERNKERERLEAEAERLRKELEQIGSQKSTLSNELSIIAGERKSLENQIAKTQNSINTIDLEIDRSRSMISLYTRKIQANTSALERIIRSISQTNSLTNLEVILMSDRLSKVYQVYDNYLAIQEPLITITDALEIDKEVIYENARTLADKQVDLSTEQEILDDQKSIIASQEAKKDAVLKQTQNKESQYQANLQTTLANIAKLASEIRTYESTLEFLLDTSKLPEKGSSVMAWPLADVFITQRFGRTVSSERLYVSGSHSGMDFRAAVGTPVYAVASGTVKGIGDTDQTCPRASFGKWIFIEHDGIGLSTTSAHLSSFKVTEGQRVAKGDLIGYSGNTGHSTGPHLHLTVYATKGVNGEEGARVTDRESAACAGKVYRMPLAPTSAYLDPINYLPPTTLNMFKHASLAS